MITILSLLLVGQLNLTDFVNAQAAVQKLQPALSEKQAELLAIIIVSNSNEVNLTWSQFTAILFQESSLKLDPKNCMDHAKTCTGDYGIGQVNYATWGQVLDINKNLMMTDYTYSIEKSVEVLKKYYVLYGHKDPNWWVKYHSKTPSLKREYQAKVKRVHDRIQVDTKDYQDGPKSTYRSQRPLYCISR